MVITREVAVDLFRRFLTNRVPLLCVLKSNHRLRGKVVSATEESVTFRADDEPVALELGLAGAEFAFDLPLAFPELAPGLPGIGETLVVAFFAAEPRRELDRFVFVELIEPSVTESAGGNPEPA